MSAEVLRRAAGLMRERAEAARPERGHWHVQQFLPEHREYEHESQVMTDQSKEHYGFVASKVFVDDANHIASWHPAVALVVADWLDSIATDFYAGIRAPKNIEHISTFPVVRHALAVANAYLGES